MADRSSKKRLHSPTGMTPNKPQRKRGVGDKDIPSGPANVASARRKLAYQSMEWSEEEDKTLTQFMLLSCVGGS